MKYSTVMALILCAPGLSQVCAPVSAVHPSGQVSGVFTDLSCHLPDGTAYDDYLIDFPSNGSWTASVNVPDGGVPLNLVLRDLSGASLGSGASLAMTVEQGTYHLLVNGSAAGPGGAYNLTLTFSAAPSILCRNFGMLGSNRQTTGALSGGSCKLPDGSPYDGYQITVYGSGTLDVSMTGAGFHPLLILRTSDGRAISSANTPDDSGAVHLSIPAIGNDTYTLIAAVSSPDQPGGAYSLSTAFTPDAGETCAGLANLTASQQYTGSISTGSCNFNLPGRGDSAFFNFYNVHVDATGVVQISVDQADFSPLLLLLDADGNTISDDIQSGGTGTPLIRQQLAPGDYRLVIFNEDSFGGDYTLNYHYSPGRADDCAIAGIDSGQQISGSLAGANACRDNIFMSDAYQIVLPVDGTVNLALSSPDFSTFLDLHDSKDNELTWGQQSPDESASFLTADLPAGTYYVSAASMDLPGGYSLSYTFTPKVLATCAPGPQMPPNSYYSNAQLGPLSCTGTDGRKSDFYRFTLPEAGTAGVFLLSTEISPELSIYKQDGTPLRRDQNSYADNNAVVIQYLPSGDYQIRTRSADPTLTGLYSIYLNFTPGDAPTLCSALPLAVSGSTAGQTGYASCAWYDKTFANVHQLTVSDATQLMDITCQSTDFDSFLILLDAKGNVMASDDNSGGGTNARIVQSLDPGTYFVIVKPADDPTASGKYVLSTSMAPVSLLRSRTSF